VISENSRSVYFGIKTGCNFLSISGLSSLISHSLDLSFHVTWESLIGVWYVEAAITGSLQSTEDPGTSSGSLDTNIKEGLEWSLLLVGHLLVRVVVFTIDFGGSLVCVVQLNLLKKSSCQQESSAVSSGVVGETSSQTVALELG